MEVVAAGEEAVAEGEQVSTAADTTCRPTPATSPAHADYRSPQPPGAMALPTSQHIVIQAPTLTDQLRLLPSN